MEHYSDKETLLYAYNLEITAIDINAFLSFDVIF